MQRAFSLLGHYKNADKCWVCVSVYKRVCEFRGKYVQGPRQAHCASLMSPLRVSEHKNAREERRRKIPVRSNIDPANLVS